MSFVTPPDFEAPTDVGGNNIYDVIVRVDDGQGGQDTQAMAVTVTDVAEGGGGFTAYNDLAWGTGQLSSNITTITSPNGGSGLPSSGQLLDFGTGLPTPVSLTVTGGSFIGDAQAAQGANPTTGDALTLFNGIVSGQGAISYINQAGSALVLTFDGVWIPVRSMIWSTLRTATTMPGVGRR